MLKHKHVCFRSTFGSKVKCKYQVLDMWGGIMLLLEPFAMNCVKACSS